MNLEKELTRREAIQGLLGAAVTAVTPIHAYPEEGQKQRRNPWPQAMTEFAGRLKPFNDSWRFHRGNVEEASSGEYDDSGWRTVNVPHDWSIEDVVKKSESIPGAIWATESKPVRMDRSIYMQARVRLPQVGRLAESAGTENDSTNLVSLTAETWSCDLKAST